MVACIRAQGNEPDFNLKLALDFLFHAFIHDTTRAFVKQAIDMRIISHNQYSILNHSAAASDLILANKVKKKILVLQSVTKVISSSFWYCSVSVRLVVSRWRIIRILRVQVLRPTE